MIPTDSKTLPEHFLSALSDLTDPIGKKFICAFSGGLDSTALLSLAAVTLGPKNLLAAHLDHCLRPESGEEALKAKKIAQGLKVKFIAAKADIPGLAKARGNGLEEAARIGRYEFLAKTLAETGFDYILTAHQANDLAETVLLKLIRGAGTSALLGINPGRDRILRPLLSFARAELAEYVREQNLNYVYDPSNEDPRFKRNLLRQVIWPELEKLNPAILAAFARTAQIALAEEEFWSSHISRLADSLSRNTGDGRIRLLAAGFAELTLAEQRRLAGHLLRKIHNPARGGGQNIPLSGVTLLIKFANQDWENGQGLDLPGGRRVERQGLYLYLGPSSRYSPPSGV
ncbi:MAG: tRNA lysidine(34) synthetase TilS [Deltaproteobacteria bacterium]|jgi:tRNA(Ile)-lysidine synthase|nr:tRNA lysidine(34) synthetase TilS [Deltaproteobacteria bacterium]